MQNKRYKLVQCYPGSPKLGTILGLNIDFNGVKPDWLHWRNPEDKFDVTHVLENPQNYPNYWQETKEVKLEVPIGTKFKTKILKNIYIIKEGVNNTIDIYNYPDKSGEHGIWKISEVNKYFQDGTWTIYKEKEFEVLELVFEDSFGAITYKNISEDKLHLYLNCCKITKVKRLKDGVTFQLKDLVKLKNGQLKGILNFNVTNVFCQIELGSSNHVDYLANLNEIQPFKQPLFLDELGNEVFEGDEIYYLCKDWTIHYNLVNKFDGILSKYKYFKNKVDTENYINENKPVFSKKQIKEATQIVLNSNDKWWMDYDYFKIKLGL